MNIHYYITIFSFITLLSVNTQAGVHGHEHQESSDHHGESEIPEGPKGGKLLSQDDISVEVTIFETGIPPEMRLYLYQDGKQVTDFKTANVSVLLDRLGGVQDKLTFIPEQDYLVSQQIVVEPHSYDVTVKANIADKNAHWHFASHEGRSIIANRLITSSGINTEQVQAQILNFTTTLFGVVEPAQNNIYQVNAPYAGLIKKILVQPGQVVKKGEAIATLYNSKTLKNYTLKSPANGEVTNVFAKQGANTNNNPILEITDLSKVWIEMSAFPEAIEKLEKGQAVEVYDMHDHERAQGKIIYIAPQMTGGHIARARTVIDNSEGHWRPGMHIKADVVTGIKTVDMAVKNSALQTFRDMDVVFAEYNTLDENGKPTGAGKTYEVRMLELGESDGEYTEVLGGIKKTDKYVFENSYLIKADVLKDGASHDH